MTVTVMMMMMTEEADKVATRQISEVEVVGKEGMKIIVMMKIEATRRQKKVEVEVKGKVRMKMRVMMMIGERGRTKKQEK